MAARGNEFKALVFMGTQASLQIVSRLIEYTEHIYAVVAPEYGYQEHPMGNLTLINNYLDDAGMQRWMDRVKFDLVIDGVSLDRPDISELIRAAAERNSIEYLKIVDKLNMISRVTICRSEEEFADKAGGVLGCVIADSADVYRVTAETFHKNGKKTDDLMAVVPPDEEQIRRLKEYGCPDTNIFCFGRHPSSEFMAIFFSEYNIEYFLLDGFKRTRLVSKFDAVEQSNVKAVIMGDPSAGEGMPADKAIKYIRKTYGLSKL